MSLLAPLFLLGSLAVALPIIFHLIRRSSRERTPFSSLMFLLPTPPRVTRRSRLENIWLLVLRCLVLCLLAFAFARPFLSKPLAPDPPVGSGQKIILLVDTSASMRRDNLWSEARAKAESIARTASPADQIGLMIFDRDVRSLVSFQQWSSAPLAERSGLIAARLQEITPGWAATHLGRAVITAAETFEASRTEDQSVKRIVLISDLQEGSQLDGLQGYEWQRGLEIVIEPLKSKRPTNAGLQLVSDRDELELAATNSGPRVRVSNSSDSQREQFQIGWTRSGSSAFVGSSIDVYIPPGQSRVVQAPKAPADVVPERLALTGDDESFDNVVYLVPPKTDETKILFLGDDPEQDFARSLYYIKRAFQQTRRQTVQVIANPSNAPLWQSDTNVTFAIVTDHLSEERSKAVKKFLSDGHTALVTMNSTAMAPTLARLLDSEVPATDEAALNGGYAMLGQIDFEHPLFAPFADPRYSDFTKIHFWKYRRMALDKIPGARVLARFDQGDPAFVQIPVGKGTLLLLTSGWHPADSQLALSSKFVPLLYSILEQSGGLRTKEGQHFVGDEVQLPGGSQPRTVLKPDGSEAKLSAADTFIRTDQPGIYIVGSVQPPRHFAVNIAPEESKTAPLPVEELQRLGLPIKQELVKKTPKAAQERRAHLQAAELEGRQKLWRWLIAAALVVLMMETWLAGRLSRRPATQTEG